jgi:hypothetical protein
LQDPGYDVGCQAVESQAVAVGSGLNEALRWDVDPIVVNPVAATAKGIVDFNGESVYTHKYGIEPAAL